MFEVLFDILEAPCQNMIYRRLKFDVACSVGLLQTGEVHDIALLEGHIRQTDTILPIDPRTFAVLYEYTDIEMAGYAIDNLIEMFATRGEKPVVAYTQVYERDHKADTIIRRLCDIFQEAKNKKLTPLDDRGYLENSVHGIDFDDIISL